MRKPSIFSRDYEKRMRKRKVRITILVLLVIIALFSGVLFKNDDFKKLVQNSLNIKKILVNSNNSSNSKQNKVEKKEPEKKENEKDKTENKPTKIDEKNNVQNENGYSVKLGNGSEIKAMYEIKDNNKKFKYISPVESTINYSINPSGKAIVIFDDKLQKMIYIDIDGNIKDVTKNEYISSTGTVFTKDAQINAKPDYIWCSSPLFIDDENIAYISNLPWFNKTTKYIWIFNFKNSTYNQIQEVFGDNVKLSEKSENSIRANVDGKVYVIDGNGRISAE